MNADVRTKLAMGARVREFCRAHPSDDPGYITLVARLEDRLARADVLAAQQRAGHVAERAAKIRRDELRASMQKNLLRHLIRVGRAVAKDNPTMLEKFEPRRTNASHQEFLVTTKVMLAEGVASKEQFVRKGLSPVILERLVASVAEFDAVTDTGMAGRAGHVGARADLNAVVTDLIDTVQTLSPINLVRFEKDPELTAAWLSATEVISQVRTRSVSPAPASGDEAVPKPKEPAA